MNQTALAQKGKGFDSPQIEAPKDTNQYEHFNKRAPTVQVAAKRHSDCHGTAGYYLVPEGGAS